MRAINIQYTWHITSPQIYLYMREINTFCTNKGHNNPRFFLTSLFNELAVMAISEP